MRCSSHKSLISFFQHPSYGKQCLLGLIGMVVYIFNTRLMGNCIRSLSLHQIQHLSTPTLWETYAVVNGPTVTRLPFSTPILRETCVFRCEVCYNVVSFTPPREPCPVIPTVFREVFEFLSTPIQRKPHAESL